ncbi:MAG: 3-hydroxyacyl-CoA dehydrogenase/enoyl-CoA hydratase family protein [Prochloraceae cyanobacterium]
MFKPLRSAVVLGAGVMGTQIAAHLANAGLKVYLLDLAAVEGNNKNAIVEAAFKKAIKQTPPILFTEKTARRIILGNFDDDFYRVSEVDWAIEAVVENMAIKQQLMAHLQTEIGKETIVSTNTSGLSIHEMVAGCSQSFRSRFLGTHFFNPPRYLKLLEIIPTPDTDKAVIERLKWFGRVHLGKGIVIAKDTPNFIANRIGVFITMLGLRGWLKEGYSIEEIDILTGTIAGRPKSATFRTADLVGLDTLVYVLENLYAALTEDESREIFQVPQILHQLLEQGALGAKTGRGFYKKEKRKILSLNRETLAYEPAKPLDLGDIKAIAKLERLEDRLRALYRDTGRAGAFFRQSTLEMLGYSVRCIPKITDSPIEIDRAIRWGFGWQVGPFQIWDILGFETVLADLKASKIQIPGWVEKMSYEGSMSFYYEDRVYQPTTSKYIAIATPEDEISLTAVKSNPQRILWQNSETALLDLGDEVVLFEFRSKGNTLSFKVLEGLREVLDLLEASDFRGMVIGNEGNNFSAGANLLEMGNLARSGDTEAIANLITQFQGLLDRIHYFPKPIVAAVHKRALAGGCEFVMACPHVVAEAETYIGLVEMAVGLIPGAGGITRMVARAAERAATELPDRILPFLQSAFETIAMAKVSSSAYEGVELGFLAPETKIVINGDRRLYAAKQEVIHLDRAGYLPPPERNAIMVLGSPARAVLNHAAYIMFEAGYASEYDRYLADRLAYVMTGGDLSVPTLVSEKYLLELEAKTFLPLLGQQKTQERIAHMLQTKKPLRN